MGFSTANLSSVCSLPILIFGQPMAQYFPVKGIEQLGKRQARPAILKDLTTPLDKEYQD